MKWRVEKDFIYNILLFLKKEKKKRESHTLAYAFTARTLIVNGCLARGNEVLGSRTSLPCALAKE